MKTHHQSPHVKMKIIIAFGLLIHFAASGNQVYVKSESYNFLIYVPSGASPEGGFPLLMFLHGSGERGDDPELVKKWGPPSFLDNTTDFPFLVVSPQCPAEELWDPKRLGAVLDEVEANNNVDINRIYITGLSIGGHASWDLAMDDPKRFAAVVPVCGMGDVSSACLLKELPAWVFHGALDQVIPHKHADQMVEALNKCGGNVRYTLYQGVDHFAWIPAYRDPELYEWLLQQKRTDD